MSIILQGMGANQRLITQGYGGLFIPVPVPVPTIWGGGQTIARPILYFEFPITGDMLVPVESGIEVAGLLKDRLSQELPIYGHPLDSMAQRVPLRINNIPLMKKILDMMDVLDSEDL